MTLDPQWLEARTEDAVRHFWQTRAQAKVKKASSGTHDQGERGAVTGGKNLDGFAELLSEIVDKVGPAGAQTHLTRGAATLPGYFRPTKDWDVLVTLGTKLLAAIEFKSQVGPSFGNNFNNRTEEAIGSAVDLWTAMRKVVLPDQAPPFLGWMIVVEDAPGSQKPVRASSKRYQVLPELRGLSYMQRYEEVCKRLMLERHYSATALVSTAAHSGAHGASVSLSEVTSFKRFARKFAAHLSTE